jgi:hypothetical protein
MTQAIAPANVQTSADASSGDADGDNIGDDQELVAGN